MYCFARDIFQPRMTDVSKDNSRPDRSRDAGVAATYMQIFMWLGSLGRINQTRDFLAIGAGSRSIFELHLDLRWFQKFTGREWAKRYWGFEAADHHRVASSIVKHKRENPQSAMDTTPQQTWLNANHHTDPMVSGLWLNADGNPTRPGFHWTGAGDLKTRARKIDPFYEGVYLQIYPVLSWLTHAGPSALMNGDFAQIEQRIGHAYAFATMHALDAAIVTSDVLGIRNSIDGFHDFLHDTHERLNAASATLPPPA
jgi:hypothetical protein